MKRAQGGFIIWVYLAALVFIGAAGMGIVHKYNSSIEARKDAEVKAAAAEASAASWKRSSEKVQGDLDEQKRLTGERTRENAALTQGLAAARQGMSALEARNAAARSYMDGDVDHDVRVQRRVNAGCSPDVGVQCVPRGSSADAAAPAAGRQEPGPDQREQRDPRGPG